MKIKLLMILALCATMNYSAVFAQDTKTAVGYLEYIGKEFRNIQQKTWKYTSSVAHGKSARKVEKNRQEVINANKEAISKVKALPAFEGSSAFRDSAVAYLKTNYAVLNEDYGKLMNMEEIAEQSYDLMEAYMLAKEKANEKLEASGNMISEEYKTFAKSHTITLVEADD
ncbi:MAG: hypothetical protein HYZ42_17410, partial [Bacteroidetes bacterium]|nr:hypothetical protein [Bacteroidota bacterium]